MSQKQKIKTSENRKGKGLGNKNAKGNKPNTTSFKKGHITWNKGKKTSNETIKKMVETRKKKGNYISWNKGKKCPEMIGNTRGFKKGDVPWNKDKPHLAIRGEKNVNWKNGVTTQNRKIKISLEYRLWRKSVFERDNFTCIWCGYRSKGSRPVDIHADHIKPFAFYPELRLAIDNGRTLCVPCHRTTKTWGKKQPTAD